MAFMPRIDCRETIASTRAFGRAYCYVLPCCGEDILKLGFSRDPLQRMRALHGRWFEFFDLDEAFLLETDRVTEARAMEARWSRRITPHNAPAPLRVRSAAGGTTEWYRGAHAILGRAADDAAAAGHRLHRPLRDWVRARLEHDRPDFCDWTQRACNSVECGFAPGGETAIVDAIDEYRALGFMTDDFLCEDVVRLYRDAAPAERLARVG
jgi:hypothetical protein